MKAMEVSGLAMKKAAVGMTKLVEKKSHKKLMVKSPWNSRKVVAGAATPAEAKHKKPKVKIPWNTSPSLRVIENAIIDGALVECDCADGGSKSILTITATHPPTKHGLYSEAAYGGCTDKRFNDFMDTLSAAPLWHFCAGSFQTCGAGNDKSDGRHIIHIDRWRIRKDSFKPSWRLEAADDADDDAEDDDDEADGAAGKKSTSLALVFMTWSSVMVCRGRQLNLRTIRRFRS